MTSWKVEELIKEFPGTVVIEENEIYSVPVTVDKCKHTILINLPPQPSPETPPILFCDPVIKNNSMISADGTIELIRGEGADGDLLAIIHKITDKEKTFLIPASSSSSSKKFSEFDLSLIDDLTADQVDRLLSDDDKFQKFMKNFNYILEQRAQKVEQVKQAAREAARKNIQTKMEVEKMAADLDSLNNEYLEASQSYQNFLVLNAAHLSAMGPENILSQIQVNLMELNDLSHEMIQRVMNDSNGHTNLDAELKDCMKKRMDYHRRAVLLKKLE